MAARTEAAGKPAPRELVLTRAVDAPRALVFEAWTDARQVAPWWGPRGFTNPVCELDGRPGGAIRTHMRGPDDVVYPMTGVFREVVEPDRLVFTSAALDAEGKPLFEVLTTVSFAEQGGRTTITLRARVVDETAAARPYLEGMEAGWTQTLARLAEHVGAPGREITATRLFDAPRELVFAMWTDPRHIVHWWGPNGFTNTIHEMDVRPGGVWRFVMHGPDGRDYQNRIVYVEVAKPERLVYDHVSGPRFHATVTFAEEGHQTRVTVRMLFETAALRDKVAKDFGAVEGLGQTLGRLADHLARSTK